MQSINRRTAMKYGLIAAGTSLISCSERNRKVKQEESPSGSTPSSGKLTKVTFGTNWYAQAEHGGFYHAVATGIYKEYGLDVSIEMGGPQINGTQLLMGGAIDFFMGQSGEAIKAIEAGIPKITVAAIFQKDPQILVAHPNTGVNSLEDLAERPIYVSSSANTTYWPLLVQKYGFKDSQKRNYNFNPAPFLADKTSAQQGYLSSEPLAIEKEGGFEPTILLLADYGYTPYGTTIEATLDLVQNNPNLVQKFVDASIKGWYSYLNDDPSPANKLIKIDNPEMTDEQIVYGIEKLTEYGIVNSGDALETGIGAMTNERWETFFDAMAQAKVYKPETDYKKAYTLEFVNKGTSYYRS